MENKKSKEIINEDNIEKIFKADIAKAGGMESLMEQTVEWENTLLRAIQIPY